MNKPKQVELTLLLIAVIIFLHFMVKMGLLPPEYNPVYDQLLISAIFCTLVSKILNFHNKYQWSLVLGQVYFIGMCILLYYAETWADYLAFAICAWGNLRTLLYIRDYIKEKSNKE